MATRLGDLHRALAPTVRALHGLRPKGRFHGPPVPRRDASVLANAADGRSLNDGPPDRRRLYGRLAALFYAGSGAVALGTLPLPEPGLDRTATAAVYVAALAISVAI